MPAGIFVSIDDAGSCAEVNEALERCAGAGSVDGASILATGPRAAEACSLCIERGIPVSAHLNCVEPPMLTGSSFPAPLGLALSVRRWLPRLEAEWRAQIEKLIALGAEIAGLDSHRHLHHLPGMAELTIALAVEYRIGNVRTGVLVDPLERPSGILLDALGRRTRRLAASVGIRTRTALAGFGRSGRVSRRYLERLRMPEGECDLVMHPSTRPVWSTGQPAELDLMTSEWFAGWKSRPGS